MARLLVSLIVLVLASGCLDGEGAAPPPTGTAPPAPSTTVRIDYPLEPGVPARRDLPPCPAGVTCTDRETQAGWARVVHRELACDPDAGDYADAAAACRALHALVRAYDRPRSAICDCAFVGPPSLVRGVIDGKRVQIPVDFCSLCGSAEARRAAAALMPAAHG